MQYPKMLYKLAGGVLMHTTVGDAGTEETLAKEGWSATPPVPTAPSEGQAAPPLVERTLQHISERRISDTGEILHESLPEPKAEPSEAQDEKAEVKDGTTERTESDVPG